MNFRHFAFTWILFGLLFILACEQPVVYIEVDHLRCENRENPLGIDKTSPRLSWKLYSDSFNKSQSAYQILVSDRRESLEKNIGNVWDSEKIQSSETMHIRHTGKSLISGTKYYWKVRVWDEKGNVSPWSSIAFWSMGMLKPDDWTAKWIGLDDAWSDTSFKIKPWANGMSQTTAYRPLPCPMLRKEFQLSEDILYATICITALGVYELFINGHRVGSDFFMPGWTDYKKRIYYLTYDVSSLLQPGTNTISAILADGWYAGNVANRGQYHYGKFLRLKSQLTVSYKNHKVDTIITDEGWKANYGPWRESDMQGGETYDARLEHSDWQLNSFDDGHWKNCVVSDTLTAALEAYPGIPIRKIQELVPKEITKVDDDTYMVNMGQNFAGWLKLRVSGQRGDSIVMRFGEKLNADGSLHTRNLRTARCTDTYVLNGDEVETWEPKFTYHGFQFVEIKGFPGELKKEHLTGVVLHSDLPQIGSFSCSDPLINQIQSNILWSQRSNYFDVPTDCPQRDERMGWTGDAQVFMKTAAFNMDISAFYDKWLVDVADGQYENGRFPSTAPRIYTRIAAGWGDAGVICPWNMYQLYNDTNSLATYYGKMKHWMSFLETKSPEYISSLGTYGDWQNVDSETPKPVIAMAYFKHCSDIMSKTAEILNKPDDALYFSELSDKIKQAFQTRFVNDSGKIEGHTQTGYLLALSFKLTHDSLRDTLVHHLVKNIESKNYHHSTGILGTHLLFPELTETGHLDIAYQLLLNEDFPSWGHQIKNGATTIWERWDSFSSEKGFHEDSTNSLNHYAYGAIGQWFYSTIGGINSIGPGFKHIRIQPQPGGNLNHAKANFDSHRGLISSSWEVMDDMFVLDIAIPANTDATVVLPDRNYSSIFVNGKPINESPLVTGVDLKDLLSFQIGSGIYHIESRK